jgi:hypothetical protein
MSVAFGVPVVIGVNTTVGFTVCEIVTTNTWVGGVEDDTSDIPPHIATIKKLRLRITTARISNLVWASLGLNMEPPTS